MKARYRYRIYPTSGQQISWSRLLGCVRVVWNDALGFCVDQYRSGNQKPSNSQLQKKFITQAKKESNRQWLSQVSNIPLQQSLRDLNTAYQNFFKSSKGERKGKPVRPPRFKRKRARQSARFARHGFSIKRDKVYLAKIGLLKVVWSRPLPAQPSSVTVIKDAAGRYFLSFVVEILPESLTANQHSVGIDLGISTFATLSTGEKIDAPKPLKKRLKRLRRVNKNLSRKQKGCKRYEKAKKRRGKLYAKIKNIRRDFLHKLSTRMIRENQTIVLEDLNVSGMVKNRRLSRAISDLGWRQFRTLLEAKANKVRNFRVINRWEPTSQVCSSCGFKGGKLDLSIRKWTCLNCGATHDRDVNAAINILVAGGHSETINGRRGECKTSVKGAATVEASTHLEFKQLSLFDTA
ncbi:RNA-guided endonuclease TnpB family protein [Roseofilum reptotaenium CS-1145]|uniref:Transposase n=1 Tax=Roseofilum reptotaenium AO1-A TaxID=1925591 RepID=A0A1L9QR09_9CYAN|nr:RNA-guided endonuclease TnpB family protein [Roseofilum reptotaenium]MDB9516840.1 RNA-guided endonuclease TnpB family protein [Roseofilum reptotaenium CS-1145]OJJ25118.1 transposase [Roseofilum reptotaenium AO1-A]